MKIKMNRRNFERDIMRGPGTKKKLAEVADRIAAAAPEGCEVRTGEGRTRSRAAVVTTTYEAMRAEAKTRALTMAVNAGREA